MDIVTLAAARKYADTKVGALEAEVGQITSGLPTVRQYIIRWDKVNSQCTRMGDAAAKNAFNGNITVTVIEVLANGNLLVSGEKQVSIGAGTEYIRLSGVVNPYFISTANTISSANVADARIEYKESGVISEAQVMGWLARFFMSVLPF